MAEVVQYTEEALPADLRWQAVSFMRVHWPSINGGALRETYPAHLQPVHFAVVEGDLLISYAAIFRLRVGHGDHRLQVDCLGNVFTYPGSRHTGHGRRVLEAVTRHILTGSADVAALLCAPELQGFYRGSGWQPVLAPTLISGHHDDAVANSIRMMLFVSEAGEAARGSFAKLPLRMPFQW